MLPVETEDPLPVNRVWGFEVPLIFKSLSEDFGAARMLMNKIRSNRKLEHDRAEQGLHVDSSGCFGELSGRYYLNERGVEFFFDPLIMEFPQRRPDIVTTGGRNIDIKFFTKDRKFLMVTAGAHKENPKGLTHYWFLKEITPTKLFSLILPFDQVSNWKLCQKGEHPVRFEPAYVLRWDYREWERG